MTENQICFDLEPNVKRNLDEIREAIARNYDNHGPFAIISGKFVRTGMSDDQITKLCIAFVHSHLKKGSLAQRDSIDTEFHERHKGTPDYDARKEES